jgi:hypothetical protein
MKIFVKCFLFVVVRAYYLFIKTENSILNLKKKKVKLCLFFFSLSPFIIIISVYGVKIHNLVFKLIVYFFLFQEPVMPFDDDDDWFGCIIIIIVVREN